MTGLRALIHSIQTFQTIQAGDEVRQPAAHEADLLLYAPCPVKLAVKDALGDILARELDRGNELSMLVPMGCTSVDPCDPLHTETDPARLPGVIASIGFGDFWRKEFMHRHVLAGVFQAARPERVNPLHEAAGLLDPKGMRTVYGVTPYVLVADSRQLGDLPIPRAWADLLDPRYKGRIVMCGDGDDMADAVLLHLYRQFGESGLARFAANAARLMHSSNMVKIAGSRESDGGAMFIMPLFFTMTTTHPAHLQVIWPEEGAAASPLYFLAKPEARLRPLVEFFLTGFPAIPSAAGFLPLGMTDVSWLPAHARLSWPGWDWLERVDVPTLRDDLAGEFRRRVQAARCG